MSKAVTPFIKWAGGKYRLADNLMKYLPANFDPKKNTYIEPMVGSGGFFFKYAPNNAYLSDINPNLIITYKVIQNDVESLISALKVHENNHHKHQEQNSKDYYYEKREEFNQLKSSGQDLIGIAALFIYLNKSCFNGLYRENSKGGFNVPMGDYKSTDSKKVICNEDNLLLAHKILRNVTVSCHEYEDTLKVIKEGDFVYLDPPYLPLDISSFTKYSKNDFGKNNHLELNAFCDAINDRGAYFMLSNSDTDLTQKIYLKEGRYSQHFEVGRSISGKIDASGKKFKAKAKELIVTNYEIK